MIYMDKSLNEDGKPEYSIHGIDEITLQDIITAANFLCHILNQKLELKAFNGNSIHNSGNRIAALSYLIQKAKKTINNEKH